MGLGINALVGAAQGSHRRAEEALRSRDEAQRLARVGNWAAHLPTGKLTWSAEVYRILGLDPALPPLTYEGLKRLFTPESWAEMDAAAKSIRQTGAPCEVDVEIVRPDGSKRWGAIRAKAVRDASGQIARLHGTVQDITERKRAEEALRKASNYTRSLIEASLDPLVTINREGQITDVNEATERATGVPRERLIGSDFCDYFTEPEKAREGYQQVFAQGSVQDYPLALRHSSGRITDVLYNATVFKNEAGEIEGVFAAARDVTEKKRAEEELARRAQELARSNADLQQFAYVASHDLQEPLRMVASFTQLLAQRYAGKLDADAKEFIGYAVDGAHRMQILVNDLLAYSRVGTRGGEFADTDCERVLETALNNLRMTIEETKAVITHDPLPQVQADEIQLCQVFQNLLGNALKFHGPDAPRVHVSAQDIRGEWRFSVRDNGIGIDPQQAQRIFVIFQRLHSRAEYPGTGLGLAIAKKIVERHGGRIWVESQPGKGSTFYFSLPMREVTYGTEQRRASAAG
ncbi:MAG: PAS domain S-box protein [Acidobacteriia bacterium]|nr:PAS domain S-box protein [Terriglobia bacterium]